MRAMAGETAMRVYGLDGDELARVAARIGAPSIVDLTTAIDGVPADGGALAFRTFGPWA